VSCSGLLSISFKPKEAVDPKAGIEMQNASASFLSMKKSSSG
jgi:hypothetical protein